jgi:hypothetical protein
MITETTKDYKFPTKLSAVNYKRFTITGMNYKDYVRDAKRRKQLDSDDADECLKRSSGRIVQSMYDIGH